MVDVSVLLITFWLAAPSPAAVATQAPGSITCEFRVFDGGNEISRETRVVVYPSGRSENGWRPDAAGRVSLAPGLYDVQAIRERDGQVAGIRRVEHLLIQRYPDERGYHLEVINFNAQYGALELKTGGPVAYDAAVFTAGDRTRQVATAVGGAGYLLFVVPAGRYDVRVKPAGAGTPETWLTDIDVPQGRTRLRTFRPPDARPFSGR